MIHFRSARAPQVRRCRPGQALPGMGCIISCIKPPPKVPLHYIVNLLFRVPFSRPRTVHLQMLCCASTSLAGYRTPRLFGPRMLRKKQISDLVKEMQLAAGVSISTLVANEGLTSSGAVMQFQADILDVQVCGRKTVIMDAREALAYQSPFYFLLPHDAFVDSDSTLTVVEYSNILSRRPWILPIKSLFVSFRTRKKRFCVVRC